MKISVVVPTRNRKSRLISLLQNLSASTYSVHEVIIVDASDDAMDATDYKLSEKLNVIYLRSEPSVCIQRNKGIQAASSPWIFMCDDDIEVPPDYLQKLVTHIEGHPECGAVSGIVLQKDADQWKGSYPITSGKELVLKYVFQLGIWGQIECKANNSILRKLKGYYERQGNHISKAGWPVITQFSGPHITVPTYGLGASMIRREWLLASPYDEVLDKHGIGDNYGLSLGFPEAGIDVINDAFVCHHHEQTNRLQKPLQYYRRALALDYFVRTRERLRHVSRPWMLWSLLGNAMIYAIVGDRLMLKPALLTFWRILRGHNPYYEAYKKHEKVVEPVL